ncbi:L-asparagine oxygenase [Streptomyces sp. Ncost-T6T-1]|uniref:TauD/TfdA family dioxygenase n=1 Tax=Streptomyces sp. Ncost-T6T-1 TaxID=1100828 RepID=UPI0008053276|nr:TauD/TfdA family dioxygenase [Streptomyces sp. Ncost-T6T-1]SBU98641.1 L-asparagine oxygenase [Streptomyces sp. Ncost-T6T-1]
MTNALLDSPAESLFTLSAKEKSETARIAEELRSVSNEVDSGSWVAAARSAWEELPVELRRRIREFRRHSGTGGALLVRGLPVGVDALGPTPTVDGSVQRTTSGPSALLLMTACGLGDPVAFRAEKSGALVQDVVPVPGREEFQGNAGSVDLMMHNENAFHGHRPDYVMLLCLRPDHEKVAGLTTSSIREALPLLSAEARDSLARPEFATLPPPSFGSSGGSTSEHAVLTGSSDDPEIRIDFAATEGLTTAASAALTELSSALVRVSHTTRMRAGDLAIVDNRVSLHGRTAFRPRYDGQDRWLQRTFVVKDLKRSRHMRPHDGYVLTR